MVDQPAQEPGTTHAEWGAGNPRLLISREEGGRDVYEFGEAIVTRIGSDPTNELVLVETELVHATIRHDDRDEFVLTLHGPGEMNANPLSSATVEGDASETLRTGARFTVGPWTLVYMREEYADHGRPYGGRQGGEFSDQKRQPPPPDYGHHGPAAETHAPEAPEEVP